MTLNLEMRRAPGVQTYKVVIEIFISIFSLYLRPDGLGAIRAIR